MWEATQWDMALEYLAKIVSSGRVERSTRPKKAGDGTDPSVFLAALHAMEV